MPVCYQITQWAVYGIIVHIRTRACVHQYVGFSNTFGDTDTQEASAYTLQTWRKQLNRCAVRILSLVQHQSALSAPRHWCAYLTQAVTRFSRDAHEDAVNVLCNACFYRRCASRLQLCHASQISRSPSFLCVNDSNVTTATLSVSVCAVACG